MKMLTVFFCHEKGPVVVFFFFDLILFPVITNKESYGVGALVTFRNLLKTKRQNGIGIVFTNATVIHKFGFL